MSKKFVLYTFITSFLLIAFTPLIFPVTITDVKQLNHVLIGAPFPFIQQDVSSIILWDLIDYKVYIKNPFEYPTTILFGNLILSLSIVFFALFGVLKSVVSLSRIKRPHRK
ncbi:hypothetical protein [Brevibacillus porteri]|uniref:hypothetical protein n=1 Tax=Brevibacillus porteri TaxID=2126350 RepID=UPI001FC984DC|nr:hypothetical protein [Brevibacillus porteri]MED1802282.1 hypothetical protein [Brevibacillus porteri]MED2129970.1 hypothetical protein [Brevibacillus porteri]MED2745715.1 hypothetical protein [Brevibacillus porteri]MED2816599.1 hypothetical protein [Brevibacillus porteri]MED2897398.1 hypothetical protein [Brevibacillus porteri]